MFTFTKFAGSGKMSTRSFSEYLSSGSKVVWRLPSSYLFHFKEGRCIRLGLITLTNLQDS